ncbi:MSMEG_4193 family putative phosphomutase [Ornithinimicrobium ciconiae]|uniref:MSMEG_4193 family putative phosphomutase n=1 Tax=Ornithinimicrobium ciconiae TaxID=2594265 RepID=A0A516GBA5_9MICO|nr:MSMEG_4193 family putative phosphomutase [Ornithinimicrobium ciconiae]QDO88782.1 MSMEG_4193 family putative phosphomutase [Ornithinimicrobium ciconiae]
MAVLVVVRHGRSTANTAGVLAGWSPGVCLDDKGIAQATRVGERLAPTPLAAVVTSPLDRCQQTADLIAAGQQGPGPARHTDAGIGECHYGAWTGRPLKELAAEPLWQDVQHRPSTVRFPPHDDFAAESMVEMRDRAVATITAWDQRIEEEHGPGAVWVAVSHGDVIKSLVSHALGSSLDRFQRIIIDPASVTIVRTAPQHPFVLRVNDTGSDPIDLTGLSRELARQQPGGPGDDAPVGGGAGSD